MNEKLKKIAKKLSQLIKVDTDVQSIYDNLTKLAETQNEYFRLIGPENFLKITIYIYSLKVSDDFKLGDKIINNLSFLHLLISQNEFVIDTCENCGGTATYLCGSCYGRGTEQCDKCNGIGSIECEECQGTGKDGDEDCAYCDGNESVDCPECDATGNVFCSECMGDGETDCPKCDNGEIELRDQFYYTSYFVVTWDKSLVEICELEEGKPTAIMSEDEFFSNDNIIKLSSEYSNANINVEEDSVYCLDITDNPKLFFSDKMRIKSDEQYSIKHLLQ